METLLRKVQVSTPAYIVVTDDSKVNVRSISVTRRAAIVDYMAAVNRAGLITAAMTDEDAETLFKTLHGNARVVPITLRIDET